MKFKITSKDLTVFCGFCVILLYFCAIAVLNVLSLVNDGEFYGLNPIEAFSLRYIFGTLIVFISVLVALFFSVSDSIFHKEKGLGIGLSIGEKDSKGYSRWLKESEMKRAWKVFKVGIKDETAGVGGIVFINDGKNIWVDDSEYHTMVVGTTGSGKTTCVVNPLVYSLSKHGESMIITDPKGELYKEHANLLKSRGYKIIVLNFRNPNLGNAWNPLAIPYQLYKAGNVDKAVELVDDVALNILQDGKAQDPFWEKSASDYFSGCALGLFEDAKEEQVNLNSINLMTTVGEEKFGPGSTYIKEYFTMKGEQSSPYVFASNTINSPTETKGGILSVFRQKIRLFASREQLSEMLAYSDFNIRDIGKEKTALFMVIHDEKTTYHALATILIKQCYETLIDVAQECGGGLPCRTNFILDEFANMPPLKDVTTMVTAARSRQIRFTFIIQNFAQLNEVYGEHDAQTIRSNCGNLIYLLTTELAALEEISKLCGEVECKGKDDKVASKPLITVSDLQKMGLNEVIIIRNRMNPFKTKFKSSYNTDWGVGDLGKAEFVAREPKEIQYFDIKEFVKLRKKSKMNEDSKKISNGFEGFGGGLPIGGMNGMPGGLGEFSPMGGMSEPPRIPTFEEFMASRNKDNNKPKPAMPTFDVDDLVKKIDAKIAELEAQEREEEEKKKAAAGGVIPETIDSVPEIKVDAPVSPTIEEVKPIEDISVPVEPIKDEKEVIQNITEQASVPNKPISFEELMNMNKQVEMPTKPFGPTGVQEIKIEEVKPEVVESKVEEPKGISTFSDLINSNNINQPKEEVTPEVIKKDETPKINVDTESKVISDLSDDAYFDDFFDE